MKASMLSVIAIGTKPLKRDTSQPLSTLRADQNAARNAVELLMRPMGNLTGMQGLQLTTRANRILSPPFIRVEDITKPARWQALRIKSPKMIGEEGM